MGQVALMNDSIVSGSEEITAICSPLDSLLQYNRVQVLADSSIHYEQYGDTIHLQGKGAVYGISQASSTGIIVDNIPMRGCLGLVFTKIDSIQLSQFYRNENVTLIIMQFGGNAIPFNEKPTTIESIVRGLRQQVRYIQSCAPHASILFIGPSDMLTTINGVEQSYPMVAYMDRLLHKMALEEQIAYFSLFRWMGGNGSMARWKEIGLASSDGIHFMRSGARKAGNAVAEWLVEKAQSDEKQSYEVQSTTDEIAKEVEE
jgi:lysophospholipase L1-like esterase